MNLPTPDWSCRSRLKPSSFFAYGLQTPDSRLLSWKFTIQWLLIGCLAATPVAAEDKPSRFELTPFAGYQFGGEFELESSGTDLELDEAQSFGLIFNMDIDEEKQYEFYYSRQETELDNKGLFLNEPVLDIDVEYFHAGGTLLFAGDSVRPYVVGTIGLSRFDPQASGLDSETFFSFSFGGGAKFFADKRIGMRLEGRFFSTLIDSDTEIFCRSGVDTNFCAVKVDGDLLWQWQAMAGLVFRF